MSGDKAVVDGIVERGIDDAVQLQQAAVLIDLVLCSRSLGDLDDGVDNSGCITTYRNSMPGM